MSLECVHVQYVLKIRTYLCTWLCNLNFKKNTLVFHDRTFMNGIIIYSQFWKWINYMQNVRYIHCQSTVPSCLGLGGRSVRQIVSAQMIVAMNTITDVPYKRDADKSLCSCSTYTMWECTVVCDPGSIIYAHIVGSHATPQPSQPIKTYNHHYVNVTLSTHITDMSTSPCHYTSHNHVYMCHLVHTFPRTLDTQDAMGVRTLKIFHVYCC